MSDELLVKYLLEEASEDERRSVEAWIGEGPENARHYRDFKTIWDESRRLAARSTVDVDAAWDRFRTRAAEEAAPAPTARKTFSLDTRFIMRLAAGLVLLIGGGLAIRYAAGSNSGEMLAIRSGAEATRATLPDGSVVTLNRNATLQYPEEFTGGTRSVTLDGEAFFEVAPDRSHPFIISANEAAVQVVGTSFNVKSSAASTEVIVATGIVDVSRSSEKVRLMPRERTTVRRGKPGLTKASSDDELYSYYRTREFVCNGTPLLRLAEILSEAYNVRIDIPDAGLRRLPITATFRNESLDEVLRVVGETLNVRASRSGNTVTITAL